MFPGGIYFIFDPKTWVKSPWQVNLEKVLPFIAALQLRSPGSCDRELLNAALILRKMTARHGKHLIVNNRVDIALASNADGVHLGEKDIPVAETRKIFHGIIGASRHTVPGAKEAGKAGADYLGCGPLFPTATKDTRRQVLGPEGFLTIKKAVSIPVIPIGGLDIENIDIAAGISDRAAVSSAVNLSPSPLETACRLSSSFK